MKPGEIEYQLSRTNRWWRQEEQGPRWEKDDPDLRRAAGASFTYEPDPLHDLSAGGLYILRGPRRVGKSVEIKRAISRLLQDGVPPLHIIHASCDGWRAADLRTLVEVNSQLAPPGGSPRYWFIDEITGVSADWPSQIKWLRDNTDFGNDCVVLSGSSSRKLDEAIKALAGRRGSARHADRTLLPMGFKSFCGVSGVGVPDPGMVRARDMLDRAAQHAIAALRPWLADLVVAWERYLEVGGFPRAVDDYLEGGAVSTAFIEAMWQIIHGEAIRGDEFSESQTRALLGRLAASLASPLNVSRTAGDVGGVHPDTINRRLKELERTYLIWPCRQQEGGMPKLRGRSKLYFTDPLLARLVALRSEPAEPPDYTQLTEQQIGIALLRQHESEAPGSFPRFETLLYQRTETGKEIDFAGPWLAGVPYEAKYVEGRWKREAQTARAAYGRGVLITRNVNERDREMLAIAAPIAALLLDPTRSEQAAPR